MATNTLGARIGIDALSDIEQFLIAAQHLKALTAQLAERRRRESGLEASLVRQIAAITQVCTHRATLSPQVADMWGKTQAEVQAMQAAIAAGAKEPAPAPAAAAGETAPTAPTPARERVPAARAAAK